MQNHHHNCGPVLTMMLLFESMPFHQMCQDCYLQPQWTADMFLKKRRKTRRTSTLVQFLCVIRCFQRAPVARGRIQMCVFFFTVRRRRREAREPIATAWGRVVCGLLWKWKMDSFNTHNHHSHPNGETRACTLNWLANARPWCEKEDNQRGEERGSPPGKGELSVGLKSERSEDRTGWFLLSMFRRCVYYRVIVAVVLFLLFSVFLLTSVFRFMEYSSFG